MASATALNTAHSSAQAFSSNIYDENHQLYQPSAEDNEFISSEESEYDDDGEYVDDAGGDADYPGAPPPIPTHSRPAQIPAVKLSMQNRAPPLTYSRSLPQVPQHAYPQIKPRNRPIVRRNATSGPSVPTPSYPSLPSQAHRPANVRRTGSNHKVTLSISSNPGDARDPAQPDPEEEGTIMITGAQAATMSFQHFLPGMFLIREDLKDPLYPAQLEPPSRLYPLRCLFCKKVYNGPNARSMWRRHITQKHQFTLGGKKGNGKGKRDVDDENRHPAEAAAHRREQILASKREYARNKRIQDRLISAGLMPPVPFISNPGRGSLPSNTTTKKVVPVVKNSGQYSSTQTYNAEENCGSMPAPRRSQGQNSTPLLDISTNLHYDEYRSQTVGYQQSTAGIFGEDDEDEDEEDADASEVNSQLALEPSPMISSGRRTKRSAIPSSDDFQPDANMAPEFAADSDDDEFSHLQADTTLSSTMISSDFDYDLSLREQSTVSSPLVPLTIKREPVLALPPAESADAPSSKSAFKYLFPSLGTPVRYKIEEDLLDEAEYRKSILSLESPTSYPILARSRTNGSITISESTAAVGSSSFLRSHTLPSFSLTAGLMVTPDRSSARTRHATEGTDVFSQMLVESSTTSTTVSSTSIGESPILKRKRTISEDVLWMNSIKDAGVWNPPETFEEDFSGWIDLEKATMTPARKNASRMPTFGDSSPIVKLDESEGRAKKKARVSEP